MPLGPRVARCVPSWLHGACCARAACELRACRVLTCLTSSPVTCIFIGHSALFSSLSFLNGIPDHALQRSPHLSLKSYRSVSSSSSRPWRTETPVMKPDGHCIARWSTLLPSLSKSRPRMPVHSPRACGSATTSAASTLRVGILRASRGWLAHAAPTRSELHRGPHVEGGALPAEVSRIRNLDRNLCCANGRVILPIGD